MIRVHGSTESPTMNDMKRITSLFTLLLITGLFTTMVLWSISSKQEQPKNWLDTVSDEELEKIEFKTK